MRIAHANPPSNFIDFVTHTPHHFDITGLFGIDLYFFPDMPDVYRYRIVRSYGLRIPDLLVNFTDGKHLSLVFHQKKKDIVFDRRQLYRIAIHSDLF